MWYVYWLLTSPGSFPPNPSPSTITVYQSTLLTTIWVINPSTPLSSQLSSSLCSQQSWSSSSLSMQNSIQMHLQSSFFQYKATSFIHTISSFTCSNVSILISHYSKYSRFCQRSVSISIQFASYSSFYSSNISNSEASMLYLKNTNFSSKKCSSFFKKLSINPHSSFFSSAPFHSFLYDKSRWVNMDFWKKCFIQMYNKKNI